MEAEENVIHGSLGLRKAQKRTGEGGKAHPRLKTQHEQRLGGVNCMMRSLNSQETITCCMGPGT